MFEVIIVSSAFEGKRLLARHKLVNEALKEEISKVHAFTQVNEHAIIQSAEIWSFSMKKSYTPEEWEKKKQE